MYVCAMWVDKSLESLEFGEGRFEAVGKSRLVATRRTKRVPFVWAASSALVEAVACTLRERRSQAGAICSRCRRKAR